MARTPRGKSKPPTNKEDVPNIKRAYIEKLARQANVFRIQGDVYDYVRVCIEGFMKRVLDDAIVYTEYGKRKTLLSSDVLGALQRRNIHVHGWGKMSRLYKIKATEYETPEEKKSKA